jgi:acetylornithine aminotransferase
MCPARKLAKLLTERSGMTNVFFCNTGLEANEAAIKIARKYGVDKGIAKPEIVVYDHAFHGRSIATMSATANPKVRNGFGDLLAGFTRVPPNDYEALIDATEGNPNIVAIMMEPIQGEGGLHPMRADYLKKVRELCDANGWLLMMDEVQAAWAAPASGLPTSGPASPRCDDPGQGPGLWRARGRRGGAQGAAEVLKPGNHGSTFGGNPLAMRAGVETIRIMEEDGLLAHTTEVGEYLKAKLQAELGSLEGFVEVRGQGLMIGVELTKPAAS